MNRGRNRLDIGSAVVEDLGFQIELWNGKEARKRANLSIRCGLYWNASVPTASVGNCVVLDFPEDLGDLAMPVKLAQVLEAAARTWEPDWAGIMSEVSMMARNFDAAIPFVDWMVYVPHRVEGLGPPSSIRELPGGGSLVVVQPSPSHERSGEGTAIIDRVEKAISNGAGP